MPDDNLLRQFIELRSQGVTFSAIAQQLGVAKSTLVDWSRDHQHLIANLRAMQWEEFLDHTLASQKERLQAIAHQLKRLDDELATRDLASVPTPRLLAMAELLRRRLDRDAGTLQFSESVELAATDETRVAIEDWVP